MWFGRVSKIFLKYKLILSLASNLYKVYYPAKVTCANKELILK